MKQNGRYSTSEFCKIIGRSKSTILKWIKQGLVEDVPRDDYGNRIFRNDDIPRFLEIRESMKEKRLGKR